MLVHAVYFWLKPGTAAADEARFVELSSAMAKIPGVEHLWLGKPADTDRPVIDRSYSYALVVVMKDMAAHDGYQVHPIHDIFREKCSMLWNKVQIYDSL
ncbi:MAG: Stress responsive alpha-beta barrel protein [Fibrobacteres bacterium]|nr:Stress responsive alpha-beta barrel protein [Fibrobacterota bacterium]